jgi:hypothetical protein
MLADINAGTAYLQGLHDGLFPAPPGISQECMTAAMKVWVDSRNHLLNNIKADFKDIAAASAAGKPIALLRAALATRIEAYNGVYLPQFMESFEAATGGTPPEGWLFSLPPREWRRAAKANMCLNPTDDPRCLFVSKPSFYMRALDNLLSMDPHSALVSALFNSSLFLVALAATGHPRAMSLLLEAIFLVVTAVAYLGLAKRST